MGVLNAPSPGPGGWWRRRGEGPVKVALLPCPRRFRGSVTAAPSGAVCLGGPGRGSLPVGADHDQRRAAGQLDDLIGGQLAFAAGGPALAAGWLGLGLAAERDSCQVAAAR